MEGMGTMPPDHSVSMGAPMEANAEDALEEAGLDNNWHFFFFFFFFFFWLVGFSHISSANRRRIWSWIRN